jgi:hypothetical protein
MEIAEIQAEVKIILAALKVPYKEVPLGNGLPKVCLIDTFGSILAGIHRRDYIQTLAKLEELYPGYRYLFMTQDNDLVQTKDTIIWELMRSGYMRYIRENYAPQFKTLLTDHGYNRKIIKERLRVWGDKAKYNYLVQENKAALNQSPVRILALEPDFFDYMPENNYN